MSNTKKLQASDAVLPGSSPVKITNGFVVLDENGEDHVNDLFNNNDNSVHVFANPSEIMQDIADYNRVNPGNEFLGTIIIANTITFFK